VLLPRRAFPANQVAEVAGALAAGDMEGMGRLMIQSRRWAVGQSGHWWHFHRCCRWCRCCF